MNFYRYNKFLIIGVVFFVISIGSGLTIISYANRNNKASDNLTKLKDEILKLNYANADTVSIYFNDLNTGQDLFINNEKFSPASLSKVPMMVAYFKLAESKPEILDRKLEVDIQDYNDRTIVDPSHSIKVGKSYKVSELIETMIIYSDNNAYKTLQKNIDMTFLLNMYKKLGIEVPDDGNSDYMTAEDFSIFLKILYNKTYLNRYYSQKALNLLGATDYKDGLVSKLPASITVAHKFGERFIGNDQGEEISEQLHDCGIIYYPNHPYLLCVMTRGHDFKQLASVISNISKTVYDCIYELN